MKRPNEYSKPLEGNRTKNYHPADLDGQYAKDLNKYIDYLETEIKKLNKSDVSGEFAAFRKFVKEMINSTEYDVIEKEWDKRAANYR